MNSMDYHILLRIDSEELFQAIKKMMISNPRHKNKVPSSFSHGRMAKLLSYVFFVCFSFSSVLFALLYP